MNEGSPSMRWRVPTSGSAWGSRRGGRRLAFDLDVAGIDTFYVEVGDSQVLVHNCSAPGSTPPPRSIVIGEDMEGRVIPTARRIGADYYDPPPAPRDRWMPNNRAWINDRMDEGCLIYNCGPAPGRANYPNPTSEYYMMQLDEIAKRDYPMFEIEIEP
jgi:hypothetical protein